MRPAHPQRKESMSHNPAAPEQQRAEEPDYTTMSDDEAVRRIENSVYEATALFERMEGAGRFEGNGHHARQKAAAAIAQEMRNRLRPPAP